ncbi:MAG: HAD-IB family hydrolase [Capnocytophaga ochracea]|jgi:HAD hydrolase, family IB
MNRPFAFFDFDGTLTVKDSLLPFLRKVSGSSTFYKKILFHSPVLLGYLLKFIENHRAKEIILSSFLSNKKESDIREISKQFAQDDLTIFLRSNGLQILRQCQNEGFSCVLVSASPEIYLKYWAANYGFDDVIGTRLQIQNGILTGKIDGENCYGEAKVRRIKALYGSCFPNSRAYSDSIADLPMLRLVDSPYLLRHGVFCSFTEKKYG